VERTDRNRDVVRIAVTGDVSVWREVLKESDCVVATYRPSQERITAENQDLVGWRGEFRVTGLVPVIPRSWMMFAAAAPRGGITCRDIDLVDVQIVADENAPCDRADTAPQVAGNAGA
jgi:hypothetical protein